MESLKLAGTCKGCGASIFWMSMESGKKMPVDAAPKKMVVVLALGCKLVDAYTPHWATCPKAANFKRKKGESDGKGPHR